PEPDGDYRDGEAESAGRNTAQRATNTSASPSAHADATATEVRPTIAKPTNATTAPCRTRSSLGAQARPSVQPASASVEPNMSAPGMTSAAGGSCSANERKAPPASESSAKCPNTYPATRPGERGSYLLQDFGLTLAGELARPGWVNQTASFLP